MTVPTLSYYTHARTHSHTLSYIYIYIYIYMALRSLILIYKFNSDPKFRLYDINPCDWLNTLYKYSISLFHYWIIKQIFLTSDNRLWFMVYIYIYIWTLANILYIFMATHIPAGMHQIHVLKHPRKFKTTVFILDVIMHKNCLRYILKVIVLHFREDPCKSFEMSSRVKHGSISLNRDALYTYIYTRVFK